MVYSEMAKSQSFDSLYINGLNALGLALMNSSKIEESDSVLNTAIRLASTKFGENHILTAQAFDNLSRTLSSKMNFKAALDPAKEAMRIRISLFGENDTLVAASYNSMDLILRSLGQYREALDYAKKALNIWELNPRVNNLEKAKTYNSLGWLYIAYGELILALDFNLKSYELRKELLPDNHPLFARSLNLIGRCYNDFGRYSEAKDYYEEALRIYISTLGPDHGNVSVTYKSLANLYARLGNYGTAIQYTKEAMRIWSLRITEENSQIIDLYVDLASAYFYKKDNVKFIENIDIALELAKKFLQKDHNEFIRIHSLYSQYYLQQKQYDKQHQSLQKALEATLSTYGKSHTTYGNVLNELSDYYNNISEYSKSRDLIEQALQIHLGNHGKYHRSVTIDLIIYGNIYMNLRDYEAAVTNYHEALLSLTEEKYANEDASFNPDFESTTSKLLAVKTIRKKAHALQAIHYQNPENIEAVQLASEAFQKGITYVERLRNTYSTEDDKIQLYELGNLMYDGAIDGLMLQYELSGDPKYAEKAFEISEKSKAFILVQELNTNKAIKYGGVPDTLLEKSTSLTAERNFLKKKLASAQTRKAAARIERYEADLFNNQAQTDSLFAFMEENYHRYYELKYQVQPNSIQEIQQKLRGNNEAIFEYYISKKKLYTFTLTKERFDVHKQTLSENFDSLITNYRKSISDYNFIVNNATDANELFVNSSLPLYQILIDKQLGQLDSVTSIIIVPDGKIGLINFEALLQEPPASANFQYGDLTYLLRSHSLSYAYSATYLTSALQPESNRNKKLFAGFSPNYANAESSQPSVFRTGENELPHARNEVTEISRMLGGDKWIDEDASKAFFQEVSPSYRINHLALHGVIDDVNPLKSYLSFGTEEEDHLTVEEIYGLKLASDLIVLSACESGDGLVRSGEGNMSLSRAFNYAGAPSVVMSLWQTGDLESSRLMVDFYSSLVEGKSKAESLQEAKLKYLKNTNDPLYSHPFFWAGFMVVGNPYPLSLNSNTNNPMLYLLMAVFIWFTLRRVRKFRRRAA